MHFVTPGLTEEKLQTTHIIGRQSRGPVLAVAERDGILNKGRSIAAMPGGSQSLGAWHDMKSTRVPFRYKSVPGRNPVIMPEIYCAPTPALTHRPTNTTSNQYIEKVV